MKGENTMVNNDFMRDEYDFSNGVVKDYSDRFTREEKLKAMLECFLAVEKINKEELKKEVDLVLA